MSDVRNALVVVLAVAALGLGLVACDRIGLATAPPPPAAVRQSVLIDQQVLSLEWEPSTGSPAVDQARATTLAGTYLTGAGHATRVEPRFGRLTLRDSDGKIVGGIQARPAWQVTFAGVAYVPSGTSASVCACTTLYQRPNTVVTLDAQTGALITLLGADN